MSLRSWPSLILVVALSGAAVLFGVYAYQSPNQLPPALLAAVICLSAALLCEAGFDWLRTRRLSDMLWSFKQERRSSDERNSRRYATQENVENSLASLESRLLKLETRSQPEARVPPVAPLSTSNQAQDFQDFSHHYQKMAANSHPPMPAPEPVAPLAYEQPTPTFFAEPLPPIPPAVDDLLNFLLEPVIDLSTHETAHYRAMFTMTAHDGHEIDYQTVLNNAESANLRTGLDTHFVEQAMPLLRRLRQRHPQMKVFLPLGIASLQNASTVERLMQILAEASDVANAVVFEIDHASMAQLGEAGIAGFASLARSGAKMALMQASVAGLDLRALSKLNVQYIGLTASAIHQGYGVSAEWLEFSQLARTLLLNVMLVDVTTESQATMANKVARFVAGSYFAPPRRVKPLSGEELHQAYAA